MVIQKVINNNVISAYDVNRQEVVIMGKGIGFKAHTGDLIDEGRIEKVFRIENEKLSRQFQEILENIPLEHMQITSDIISYARKNLNVQLNQNIYITLMDHICHCKSIIDRCVIFCIHKMECYKSCLIFQKFCP